MVLKVACVWARPSVMVLVPLFSVTLPLLVSVWE